MLMELKVKELGIFLGLICVCGLFWNAVFISGDNSVAVELRRANDMSSFRAVFVTTPSIEVAKKIAHGLVANKLAACVNIIPQITSVYEWEGKINEDSELLLMIKTQSDKFDQIDKFVKENHPYDVPEVIALPIDQGSDKYLQWIKDIVGSAPPSDS